MRRIFSFLQVAVAKLFGRRSKKVHSSSKRPTKRKKKVIVHKNSTGNGHLLTTAGGNAAGDGATHVVHPTAVRTNIPFKRKVNEVRRAATKAKRVARSQLGRPYKKPNLAKKTDGAVTSPTESEKSLNNPTNAKTTAASPSKTREKSSISSRFSIISFKPFKPKPISPDKSKAKVYDKRKSAVASGRRAKAKSKNHPRSKSPDKKRKSVHEGPVDPLDKVKSRSPSKRMTFEDERRKSRPKSSGPPDKAARSSSPEKGRKYRAKSPEKNHKLNDGNWLIKKFLADEEKIAKPVPVGSLAGSLAGSLTSVAGAASGSPVISHNRSGSTRALLATATHASPARGIVNEAFIGSPRNARTHSSLRVTKSASPEEKKVFAGPPLCPNKYRRSVSMVAYNDHQAAAAAAAQDKRKRSTLDEGAADKKRRFSSPEKPLKPPTSSPSEEPPVVVAVKERTKTSPAAAAVKSQRRRSASSLPSSVSSSNHSFASVPDRMRQKLSLITAGPEGSLTSVVVPEHAQAQLADQVQPRSSQVVPKIPPKDWV